MSDGRIRILLGQPIPVRDEQVNIDQLKFLSGNPRVYACTHGLPGFADLTAQEQQDEIYKKLLDEPSVKNLLPEVRRNKGLVEPIVVRYDTMEVIEGNSRLAAYRKLRDEKIEGDWEFIPCEIIVRLTEEQQAAFLHEIHVRGKTQWLPYEKANFAYVRKMKGWSFNQIAELFGESVATIRTRFNVIKMMKDNEDNELSHFSFYNVIVRTPDISKATKDDDKLRSFLLDKIKVLGSGDEVDHFGAQDLREKLPTILEKPRVLKKYMANEVGLDGAYQRARISQAEDKVRKAREFLDDVSKRDVLQLSENRLYSLRQAVRLLSRSVKRIEDMMGQ